MGVRRKKVKQGVQDSEFLKVEASGDNNSNIRHFFVSPDVGWGNVITDTLTIKDPAGIAKRLRDELTIDDHTSYSLIVDSLNRAASNYELASRLFRAAKVEEVKYELLIRSRFEVMRTSAIEELMLEYRNKQRKSPTNDDIESRMQVNWSDEYNDLKIKSAEFHGAVRSLEKLMEAWKTRSSDLRAMVERVSRVVS